ncbi:MAG: PQQ-dependent sugar dehydrogenase, partial [Gemmataceae bacterium]|nr:PQQ-dependent sugar dehydrogenase [Gemmataceae bacterium]
FYQGEEIYGPLGVCVAPYPDGKGQKVFVCQSPDILVFEDKDGDLKADGPPKKFLSGFRGFDHDHGVHGINIGPDGKLYFTVGDSGVDGLQSSDGKGRKWKSNDTDCRAGTVWRCDMDGTNLELIAHNFRNNYEACVDSFGEIWLSDNDDDGNQQTRICFVMPGGNYGYHPRGPGQTHWHEEQPGIVHKTLRTGFGSPTGITFYEGSLFPKKYTGALLHCDAGPREVRWFFRKPKGAGYELDKEVLLTSSDNWFRPSDVCVAPDGSIFVADWYDRGVGGHGMGDPTDGRIYRITPKGHKGYKVPEVKLDTLGNIFSTLSSPNQSAREMARMKLQTRVWTQSDLAEEYLKYLSEGLSGARVSWAILPDWHRMESLSAEKDKLSLAKSKGEDAWSWIALVLQIRGGFGNFPDDYVGQMLQAQYGRIDYTGVERGIVDETEGPRRRRGGKPPFGGGEEAYISEYPPAYRRELILGLRNREPKDIKLAFFKLARAYDGQDIFYRAALNIACGTDPARRDAILADFDTHFPEWNDKVADLVWELRPKSVLPRLGKLLSDPKLTGPQKA